MSILTLIVPAIAVLLIAAPLVSVAQGKVTGKSAIRNRFALHFGAFALACICAVAVPASGVAFAETAGTVASSIMGTNAQGMGFLAAALVTGLAAIGAGVAVASAAPAAIGAVSEDPKAFGKAIIFVVLGEGIAIYGLLISILIINKL